MLKYFFAKLYFINYNITFSLIRNNKVLFRVEAPFKIGKYLLLKLNWVRVPRLYHTHHHVQISCLTTTAPYLSTHACIAHAQSWVTSLLFSLQSIFDPQLAI